MTGVIAPTINFQTEFPTIQLLASQFGTTGAPLDNARLAMARGDYQAAAVEFHNAYQWHVQNADMHADFAICLRRMGLLQDAYTIARIAVELDPDHCVAMNELGNIFRLLGQVDSAVECYRHAVDAWPAWQAVHNVKHFNEAELRSNYGVALQEQSNSAEAVAEFRRALALDPTCAGALWNLPLALLTLERFEEGWAAYAKRWDSAWMEDKPRGNGRPLWRGETLPPMQRLHVWGEQGVGDEILYASTLAGWMPPFEVVIECNPKLEAMFNRAFPHFIVVPKQIPQRVAVLDDSVVAQISMGGLAQYLRPNWTTHNRPAAYLSAQPTLSLVGGLTVGIAWSSPGAQTNVRKSIPERMLDPILSVPGVQFVDLQYGDTAETWRLIHKRLPDLDVTRMGVDHFNNLDAHASLIASCDLVIAASNSTAHLAGAMGKETWVMVPKGQGQFWYWFKDRTDSLVYPNAKLFRQETLGDWTAPIACVAAALQEKILTRSNSV